MKYISSRGGSKAVSFEEAIGTGYAADGGLYMPETLPAISKEDLEAWKHLDYASLAFAVLWPFVEGEMEADDLRRVLAGCYDDFSVDEKVRVVSGFDNAPQIAIAELFHGPTFCFKDLGLQVLVRLLSHFASRRGDRKTLLVATTGDTGPAALRAAADVDDPHLRVVVFFPEGMVSELQRLQMTTHASASVRVATFQGGGDDMDAPLKRMAMDGDFAAAHGLCGINSYNICRPLAQMVHYVWTWLRCREQFAGGPDFVLDIVVPTGAMGNLAAATLCKRRGLPLGALCAATNVNDISYRAISRGDFSRAPAMQKTLSDAINIQTPYNFERVLYYARLGDARAVADMMKRSDAGDLQLDADTLAALKDAGPGEYRAARVDDDAMLEALRRFHAARGYVCDPHTAVAVAGADELGYAPFGGSAATPRPVAILATAHPCKFQAAVTAALGDDAWTAYEASDAFPEAARALATRKEIAPLVLSKRDGETLHSAQLRWESVVRAVLEDPGGLHSAGGAEDVAGSETPAQAPPCKVL